MSRMSSEALRHAAYDAAMAAGKITTKESTSSPKTIELGNFEYQGEDEKMYSSEELTQDALADLLAKGKLQDLKERVAELFFEEKQLSVINKEEAKRKLLKMIPDSMMLNLAKRREALMSSSPGELEKNMQTELAFFKKAAFEAFQPKTEVAKPSFEVRKEPYNPFAKRNG